MNYRLLLLFTSMPLMCLAQISKDSIYPGLLAYEKRDLSFDALDLKIIIKADTLLSDATKWSKADDRLCDDDIAADTYSLYCALYKASIEVAGVYEHRRAAMQIVRFVLESYEQGRVKEHRLMDWNNHPDTQFSEVKKVLSEAIQIVKKDLED